MNKNSTKNFKVLALILLTSILLLVAINQNIPTVNATGTATVDILTSVGGTTTPAVGTYTNYTVGTVGNFTAVPGTGFNFLYWIVASASGASTFTTNPLAYNITASTCAIQAMFIPTSNATLSVSGSGTATIVILTSVGGATVPAGSSTPYTNYTIGTVGNFTAVPGTGFKFLYWIVATSSASTFTTNPLAYNITASTCAIQAMFIPTSSTVTLPTPTPKINEFSSATAIIMVMVLVIVAFGTYAYTRKAKK